MSVIALTAANFDEVVDNRDMVVIDFWAQWCGPCKSFAPVFKAVSEQYPDVLFANVDTEKETKLAEDFNIRSIPLVMILRQNIVVYSESGALPASALEDLIEQAKALDMDAVRAQLQDKANDQ